MEENKENIEKSENKDYLSSWVDRGYVVVSNIGEYTTLKKPKTFSWFSFIMLSVFFNVFGFFGYIIYYWSKDHDGEMTIEKGVTYEEKYPK